jgi:hypothetical protein
MEKQTKILLGVGAVIAAYLILKPKKAAAQTNLTIPASKNNTSPSEPDWDSLKSIGDNKQYGDVFLGSRRNVMVDKYGNEVVFIQPEGGQSYSVWNIKDKEGKIIKSIRYDAFGKEMPIGSGSTLEDAVALANYCVFNQNDIACQGFEV